MVKKLRRSNLSADAYAAVRELFVNGSRYHPGDKISVEALSRELGVSRTPLWGAINRLEAEGVVTVLPRQGVYLIDFDIERALDIFAVREALEGVAARLAAERATDRQLGALQTRLDAQHACASAGDVEGYHEAALKFHGEIAGIAANPTLERHLTAILAQIRALRLQRRTVPLNLTHWRDDHVALMRALLARDPEAAERAARRHIQELAAELRRAAGPESSLPAAAKP